ncbi:MAG: cytochrome c oxidase subunit II [Rickettsiaceae bacterium H1]|nr:cytochrome c oxidase subunit II [Rickettsiaceae bacterium H1]
MGILKAFIPLFIFNIFPFSSYSSPPVPWQLGFQQPATEVMERIYDFHNMIMFVMVAIVVFVLLLLSYVLVKFSKKNNPVPSKTSHNTVIEVVWSVIPLIIVGLIAVPSIKLLAYKEKIPESEMTIKIVGYQWYWGYEYVDHDNVSFDSNIKRDLEVNELRLFEVDNRLVIPVNTNIKMQITGADVIHSWAVPAFGVKKDAIPGRLNETWINVNKAGVYYGQCSELCGVLHGFMPIVVEAVSKEDFNKWIKSAKEKFV